MAHVTRNDGDIREIGEKAGRPSEWGPCKAVAQSAYKNALAGGAQAWLRAAAFKPVDESYLTRLS